MTKKTSQVFGISNVILVDSYVDRGDLDEKLLELLSRPTHVALRGESKCGKSWLRQKIVPNAINIQCRLNRSVVDLYVDALSQLDIKLSVDHVEKNQLKGRVQAKGEFGTKLLAAIGLTVSLEASDGTEKRDKTVGHDINDLRFVADIIRASGRRLVIEDFHYMSLPERTHFAFDLKAMWDYGLHVIIVGVWSRNNMILTLNPDLAGRINEVSVAWTADDLRKILTKGGMALQLEFSNEFADAIIGASFGNAGILQSLALTALDELKIKEALPSLTKVADVGVVQSAAMAYAEQLNPLYQVFAERVSGGIRTRQDSTGIYAHAIAVIMNATDAELIDGLSVDAIFNAANKRQPRIQLGNLKKVLQKFEELQVDKEGRGLVLAYNGATEQITAVDRQLLLYRRYATIKWPWEDMIAEADYKAVGFGDEAPGLVVH